MIYFTFIFVLFLFQYERIQIYGAEIKCASCASEGLKVNWAATTLSYPKNSTSFFDSSCNDAVNVNKVINCQSPCFSMAVNLESEPEPYIVRGCMSDFFDSPTISEIALKISNGTEYCLGSLEDTPKKNTFETNCEKPTPIDSNTCYKCNKLYGDGKCKPNKESVCTGNYCVKVTGHYGDAKFEERRCSNINPYLKNTCVETETQFPLSLAQSVTGDEIIKSTVCYCDGNLCNSTASRFVSITTFFFTIIFIIYQ
ncbi:Hypothetical protein SRAE_X000069200 [Strongyloides ratti]|uniref:Caenorhabditis elegans ly-6-related family-containing protein n=1 Tax=Strongyloides ratti TaxID=34506 RepID=A0A090LNC4_STRRB|nr:Hypothetical protein SRAE_X000069200 [Strongyloides ratti]CEF71365.1 Hypothetical protein SRAE_X000069200 [Strongyloides ratti]